MDTKQDKKEFVLPFGIDFVVQQDLGSIEGFKTWRANNSSYDINCPFCGGKRKMNINTAKDLARCNKCGGGNGYNRITLHAALTGLNNKEAYKDLMQRWNGLGSDVQVKFQNNSSTYTQAGNEPADIYVRDMVYRKLLSKLSLSDRHREDLIKRGLNGEQIIEGMYKTVPVVGLHTLAYEAVFETDAWKELEKHKYWGIPGFVDVKDRQKISLRGRKNGYFVPVKNRDGLISGMQIRYDNLPDTASDKEKEAYKKYSWYSSSEKDTGCGVTGCENIHYAGDWKNLSGDSVNLTEGVLKSDIASALSGKPFMGLVGVNNIRQLGDNLFKLQYFYKISNVILYIDMDYKDKPEVAAALLSIKRTINSVGVHNFNLLSSTVEGANISSYRPMYKENAKQEFIISFGNDFVTPKKVILYIDKSLIPHECYEVRNNSIVIDYDLIKVIRNQAHIIRISDATLPEYDDYDYLTAAQKKTLIRNSLIATINFEKTGLTYHEMNWPQEKGIDDYYLYLKKIGGKFI